MKIVVDLDASPEFRKEMFPETPEEWAEKLTADIYDRPAIETRQEFKQALLGALQSLRTGHGWLVVFRDCIYETIEVYGPFESELEAETFNLSFPIKEQGTVVRCLPPVDLPHLSTDSKALPESPLSAPTNDPAHPQEALDSQPDQD